MLAAESLDPGIVKTNHGLVHLASELVQLLWLHEAAGVPGPRAPQIRAELEVRKATEGDLLRRAGGLLDSLARDTRPLAGSAISNLGALPSADALEASGFLLEASDEAGFKIAEGTDKLRLGGLPFDAVKTALLAGSIPPSQVRGDLIRLFQSVARVAARGVYDSPVTDLD